MFFTKIDSLDQYDGQTMVIVLGDCQIPKDISPAKVVQFSEANGEALQAIGMIDTLDLQAGITLVVSSFLAENSFDMVRLIQKHLVFTYIKYVWFPKQDTATPDPFGVGGDKGPLANLVYDINMLDNLPFLMGTVRTKELEGKLPSTPVLLLAAGPSLKEIGPHLKELSKRFIVVCLARSLRFCQEHDVVPDIVVQLDTHGEQKVFYPKEMNFSKTWLLALSCAPVKSYSHRFAGVYWIDTFHKIAFGNDYELRNSWLSSLIPMLGVAELFNPAKVLVIGADLSFKNKMYYDGFHAGDEGKNTISFSDEIGAINENVDCIIGNYDLPIHLNDGSLGATRLQFLATAFEAESIASELAVSTQFYNLSQSGILGEAFFQYQEAAAFMNEPELDKGKVKNALLQIGKLGQYPDEQCIQRWLREKKKFSQMITHDVDLVAINSDPKTLGKNPFTSAGKIFTTLHSIRSGEKRFNLARKLIHKHAATIDANMLMFRFKGWISMGKRIPIYCYPHEQAFFKAKLETRFPKGSWEFRNTWSYGSDPMENHTPMQLLSLNLEIEPVALMSRLYAESADYILPLLDSDTYLIAEDILEVPWPMG